MINYLFRHNKDYSRFNIIKKLCGPVETEKDIYILLPFSKNQFLKHFFKRDRIVNDFFISNYDTYVYDRKKITRKNPRAWWKYFQDWFNFRFSNYLLSDTEAHFKYWEKLFGKFQGQHFVLPVLADTEIYYPPSIKPENETVRILFYGSFIPLHGIDIILKAFKQLEDRGISFEAKMIGKGQTFPEMKALHEALKLKQVSMNGETIPENELAEIIRQSDIILGIFGNSKKASSVIPNKVYQSTACGKCTVTKDATVLSEFYSPDNLVTCSNTPEDLSSTLEYLISDRSKISAVADSGYQQFNTIYQNAQADFAAFLQKV